MCASATPKLYIGYSHHIGAIRLSKGGVSVSDSALAKLLTLLFECIAQVAGELVGKRLAKAGGDKRRRALILLHEELCKLEEWLVCIESAWALDAPDHERIVMRGVGSLERVVFAMKQLSPEMGIVEPHTFRVVEQFYANDCALVVALGNKEVMARHLANANGRVFTSQLSKKLLVQCRTARKAVARFIRKAYSWKDLCD